MGRGAAAARAEPGRAAPRLKRGAAVLACRNPAEACLLSLLFSALPVGEVLLLLSLLLAGFTPAGPADGCRHSLAHESGIWVAPHGDTALALVVGAAVDAGQEPVVAIGAAVDADRPRPLRGARSTHG